MTFNGRLQRIKNMKVFIMWYAVESSSSLVVWLDQKLKKQSFPYHPNIFKQNFFHFADIVLQDPKILQKCLDLQWICKKCLICQILKRFVWSVRYLRNSSRLSDAFDFCKKCMAVRQGMYHLNCHFQKSENSQPLCRSLLEKSHGNI